MKPAKQQPIAVPDDLVPMGFVAGAFGIRGWVKVVADTEFAESLFDYPIWWLGRNGQWRAYKVVDSSVQPRNLNAQLEGVSDRDVAAALKGMTVAVPRSEMPATDPVLPVRLKRTPGVVASRSTISTVWRFSIVSASMIVIA